MEKYDLIVIGSGPAGQRAAIQAAKFGKRSALIEKLEVIGGAAINTGTIPSKSVREAIFQLTGSAVKSFYGNAYRGNGDISVKDLAFRVQSVVVRETDVVRAQLKRNGIAIYQGLAQFVDPHTIEIRGESDKTVIRGEHVLIACGTRPAGNNEG